WPKSLMLLPVGGVAGYGPTFWGWLRHQQNRPRTIRHLFTGSRPVRVTLLVTGATILMMAGLVFILISGAFPSWATVENENLRALRHVWIFGLGFIVIGTGLYTRARRLAAQCAGELINRDTRSPVLYLRAFADDNLKLRTETYNRPFVIERLSPFRFDRFEEI